MFRWLREGGRREDEGGIFATLGGRSRFFRHFHDPLRPWDSAGLLLPPFPRFESSVRWMQRENQEAQAPGTRNWSWQDARRYYLQALTRPTKDGEDGRDQAFANLFRALGQVMHLVTDASVPEHVRNDPHPLGPIYGNYEYRLLELHRGPEAERGFIGRFLANPRGPDPAILQQPTGDAQASVPVARLIDTDTYTGLASGPNVTVQGTPPNVTLSPAVGIAEMANANFFSEDTSRSRLVLPDYPFPDVGRLVRSQHPAPKTGRVRAYFAKGAGDGLPVDPVLAECVLDEPAEGTSVPVPYTCVDEKVWENTAQAMLPRAVGYSAGLLDYFFRGRLKGILVRAEGTPLTAQLRLTNEGSEEMQGDFQLYAETPEGTRTQIAGPPSDSTGEWTGQTLAPGATRTFTFPVPGALVAQFFVVFQGRLGLEEGAVVGRTVGPEFLEEWDRGLTGAHAWAHNDPVFGLNPELDKGTSTTAIVAGRLIKDNIRDAEARRERFNRSLLGGPFVTVDGSATRDFLDILGLPVTAQTEIQVKIDAVTINAQPPAAPGVTSAFQFVQFEFTEGRYLQLTVPGQAVNLGPNGVIIFVTPGVPVAFRIHDVFRQFGLPVDNLVLTTIRISQNLSLPEGGIDHTPRQQHMEVDYLRVGEALPPP